MKKSLFEYDNYREFLKDFYNAAKETNKNFSFRYFSRIAGFKSGNVLKIVMDGKRNIAPYSIEKFVKALKLNKQEGLFFKNLVLFNQADSLREKQYYAQEIIHSKKYKEIHPLGEAQYNYFAYWYFVPIRELVTLPGASDDPEWIASQLIPKITPQEARRAIEALLKIGLLTRDSHGKLIQTNGNVSTPDEVTASSVTAFHREMIKKAGESIERVPREGRDISGITMIMSPQTRKMIKEKLQAFRKEIVEMVSQHEQNPESIYQLNFQFFPLASIASSEDSE